MGMTSPLSISPRVMNSFVSQPWRGNVQELECAVERAVALDRDGIIGMDDLPARGSQRSEDKVLQVARKKSLTLSDLEREYILEVLAECEGSRKKTAERLGITTATLWRKLKQYETQPTNNR
jgi:DNA-binding NtrC family response regulator